MYSNATFMRTPYCIAKNLVLRLCIRGGEFDEGLRDLVMSEVAWAKVKVFDSRVSVCGTIGAALVLLRDKGFKVSNPRIRPGDVSLLGNMVVHESVSVLHEQSSVFELCPVCVQEDDHVVDIPLLANLAWPAGYAPWLVNLGAGVEINWPPKLVDLLHSGVCTARIGFSEKINVHWEGRLSHMPMPSERIEYIIGSSKLLIRQGECLNTLIIHYSYDVSRDCDPVSLTLYFTKRDEDVVIFSSSVVKDSGSSQSVIARFDCNLKFPGEEIMGYSIPVHPGLDEDEWEKVFIVYGLAVLSGESDDRLLM